MTLTLQQKLQFAWNRLALEFIPPPHSRKPITWRDVPNAFAYVLLYGLMAYLARRRDTQIARLLLLPSIIYLAIRGTFYYDFTNSEYIFHDWCRGITGLSVVAISIDLAFERNGRLKIGEKQLPYVHEPTPTSLETHSIARFLPSAFVDGMETAVTLRWIGWEVGKGVFVPPDSRPKERSAFLKATFWEMVKTFFVVDLCVAGIKILPGGIGSATGGTVFLPDLPPVPRYIFSTMICVAGITGMIAGFNTLNSLCTLVAVGILGQSPEQWPPLMHNPWASDSIADLWARRWHQMLRRVFLVYGGIPGGWIAGRPGVILGSFVASGLLHEYSIYVLGRGLDHRVTFFFTFQGVCVLLEVMWYKATGHKVRGWGGRVWTYCIVLITGQACLDAWLMRGLASSVFVPPCLSPAQLILLPTLRQIIATLR
ncbi:hypothetical protein BC835DRAFT_1328180 [Cytidiella melzeri]|nr:hypothetical protein BC835DRAFT_1328180 [Cytidiella melzeri]